MNCAPIYKSKLYLTSRKIRLFFKILFNISDKLVCNDCIKDEMEFEIKGIKFNREDLLELEISKLKAGSISNHHLFHLFGNGKAILLLRAGDFIDSKFISNYIERGILKVQTLEVVTALEIEELSQIFLNLKNAKNQKEQQIQREIFLELIKNKYHSSESSSFLSLVAFLFNEFYKFPEHVLVSFQETSSVLFTRALRVSSMGVVNCILNGMLDYKFIHDFYNVCFIMDYGLVEYGKYHYTLAVACEVERKKPGMGLNHLKKLKRSEGEKQLFINHPTIAVEFAKTYSASLYNPELIEMINYHHEKQDGSGFPNGVEYSALSDAEAMLTFCDHMVPFSEPIFDKGDLKLVLIDSFEELRKFYRETHLPVSKLIIRWEGFISWIKAIKSEDEVA